MKDISKMRQGVIYRCMQVFYGKHVEGCGTFVVIDKDGESCYIPTHYTDRITGKSMQIHLNIF